MSVPSAPDVRPRALARNTVFNLLGQGLPLLVALVAVPILLRELGAARFGVLGLVWMFVTIFGELGFGRAGTKYAAQALGSGRTDQIRKIVGVTLAAQLVLGFALGLLLVGLAGSLTGSALSIEENLVAPAKTSFLVLGAVTPALLLGSAFRGFLEAQQRFGVVNVIRFWTSTLNYLLPVVVVLNGGGLVPIVGVLMGLRVVGTLAFGLAARSMWASVPHGEDRGDLSVGDILSFGGWVTVSTVVSPILVYIDRFLLGALVSVAAVGVYTAPYEIVTRVLLVPAALASTLFPAVSALRGMDDPGAVARAAGRATGVIALLVTPVAAVCILGAGPMLRLWLGPETTPEMVTALRLLAPGVFMNALAFVPLSVLQGSGRADLTGRLHLAELPVHCVVAWWLVGAFGIAGAAGAWSLRTTADSVGLFWLARRVEATAS